MPIAQKKRNDYPICPGQLRKLHALRRALGIDEEAYRARLAHFGVASSKDLTMRQADALLAQWEALAVEQGLWTSQPSQTSRAKEQSDLANRTRDMASPAQLRMIQALWKEVSRAVDDEGRKQALNRFCARIVKKDHLRFVTRQDASKLIKALESMRDTTPNKAGEI